MPRLQPAAQPLYYTLDTDIMVTANQVVWLARTEMKKKFFWPGRVLSNREGALSGAFVGCDAPLLMNLTKSNLRIVIDVEAEVKEFAAKIRNTRSKRLAEFFAACVETWPSRTKKIKTIRDGFFKPNT